MSGLVHSDAQESAVIPTEQADAAAVVWVVSATVGEYSDRGVWTVRAFEDEAAAKAFVEHMNALGREWWNLFSEVRYVDEHAARDASEAFLKSVESGWCHDYTGPADYFAGPIPLTKATTAHAVGTPEGVNPK